MIIPNLTSTDLQYTKKMLTTQITGMKKNLGIFDAYANHSGLGVDQRGVVTGSPGALNVYYATHPGSVQFANFPLPFYSELLELFGSKFSCLFSNCDTCSCIFNLVFLINSNR